MKYKSKVISICLLFSFIGVYSAKAQLDWWQFDEKLIRTDRKADDRFGGGISVEGNTAFIGAYTKASDINGVNAQKSSGIVYVYTRAENGKWHEVQKLESNDRASEDQFGANIAILGEWAVISAAASDLNIEGDDYIYCAGAAYIFKKGPDRKWVQHQKIVSPHRSMNFAFGFNVAITDGYIFISEISHEPDSGNIMHPQAGSVHVYQLTNDNNWEHVDKLVGKHATGGTVFGRLSVCGDKLIVGGTGESVNYHEPNELSKAGAAYIYQKTDQGKWEDVQYLVSPQRIEDGYFGGAVLIKDSFAFVRSNDGDDPGPHRRGCIYVFKQNASGEWKYHEKLSDIEGQYGNAYGNSLAIYDNVLVVGSKGGSVYINGGYNIKRGGSVFIYRLMNNHWKQTQKIISSDNKTLDINGDKDSPMDFFGDQVAIAGKHILITSQLNGYDPNGQGFMKFAGSVYAYSADINAMVDQGDEKWLVNAYDTIPIVDQGDEQWLINAFSPNADGVNDVFKIPAEGDQYEYEIYNRWGELLYIGKEWNGTYRGKMVPNGSYLVLYKPDNNGDVNKLILTVLR